MKKMDMRHRESQNWQNSLNSKLVNSFVFSLNQIVVDLQSLGISYYGLNTT